MRLWILILVSTLLLIAQISAGDQPVAEDVIRDMRGSGHILMIRHALAPGTGDPANFKIGDCSTQRNLDSRGREQARAIGTWLRSAGITSAKIYSSQWCRCLETAELLKMGPVTTLAALNSFYELPQNREPNLKALRNFIARQPHEGSLIILVTHLVTISAISGETVSSGEGVLLKLNPASSFKMIGRLNFY